MTQVDTMRAVVRAADPNTLAYLLNIIAGKLRDSAGSACGRV
jgi:hypothetical protein